MIGWASCVTVQVFADEGKTPSVAECGPWLERTLKKMESVPMMRQRDVAILAVGRACKGVPEALRKAAVDYSKASAPRKKARALADAAGTILKDNCSASDPLATAGSLVTSCPLPGPGEKAAPEVLGRMRAADYLFLNALMTSLIAAEQYNHTGYRIVLNYILSSALLADRQKGR